jgi:hypothetical protein
MLHVPAFSRPVTYRVGLGFGLAAAVVAGAEWALTVYDYSQRAAPYETACKRMTSLEGFCDETNLVRGNEWFWLGTSFEAAAAVGFLCFLAAVTAAWVSGRRYDGVIAAWIVAATAALLYLVGAVVVLVFDFDPFADTFLPCMPLVGLVVLVAVYVAGYLGARLGVQAKSILGRRR